MQGVYDSVCLTARAQDTCFISDGEMADIFLSANLEIRIHILVCVFLIIRPVLSALLEKL